MSAFIAYVFWIIFSAMPLRWGVYLGTGHDLGIISPLIIMFSFHIWIAPLITKK